MHDYIRPGFNKLHHIPHFNVHLLLRLPSEVTKTFYFNSHTSGLFKRQFIITAHQPKSTPVSRSSRIAVIAFWGSRLEQSKTSVFSTARILITFDFAVPLIKRNRCDLFSFFSSYLTYNSCVLHVFSRMPLNS